MKLHWHILLTIIFTLPVITANGQNSRKNVWYTQPSISVEGNPCVNDSVFFSHDQNNYQVSHWYFGDGKDSWKSSPFHIYTEPGDYEVSLVITYESNEKDSISTTVSIGTPPEVQLEYGDSDFKITEGTTTTITAKGNFSEVEWFRQGNSLTTSRTVTVSEEGYYTVIARDENGCATILRSDSLIVMPPLSGNDSLINVINNVITPNGDGYNDFLIIENRQDYADPIIISIYNVWGDKVYESTDYRNERWKGEGLDAGTYYYHIRSSGRQGLTGFVDVIK